MSIQKKIVQKASLECINNELARKSYSHFLNQFFEGYKEKHFHKRLVEIVEKIVHEGGQRIIIDIPPQHGKSELICKKGIPWILGKRPDFNIIFGSYSDDLAMVWSRRVKDLIKSNEYLKVFPETQIKKGSNTVSLWETTAGGLSKFCGVRGGVTGLSADLVIIDDPYKNRQEAESEVIRQAVKDQFDTAFSTRIKPNASIVVIHTRWHEDDLIANLKNQNGWEQVSFPANSEPDCSGNWLFPERYSDNFYHEKKKSLDLYDWEAIYMGNPSPKEGGVLNIKGLRTYTEKPKFSRIFQVIDGAVKTDTLNSYSVITTIGVHGSNLYVLDLWRNKVEYPKLKKAVRENYLKWHPSKIIIEDKSSGQQLIQELKGKYPIKVVKAVRDKVERAGTLSDVIDTGRLYLPKNENYFDIIKSEMAAFPNGKYDDIVDTLAYAAQEVAFIDIRSFFGDVWRPEEQIVDLGENPPSHWYKFRSIHWGSFHPFCVLWWVYTNNDVKWNGVRWPRGAYVIFKEWYGAQGGSNNIGLRYSPEQIAEGIIEIEQKLGLANVRPGQASENLWAQQKGPKIYQQFAKKGVKFIKAFGDEQVGMQSIRSLLHHKKLFFNNACKNCIRTIPDLIRSERDPDLLDKNQELGPIKTVSYIVNAFSKRFNNLKRGNNATAALKKNQSLDDSFGY